MIAATFFGGPGCAVSSRGLTAAPAPAAMPDNKNSLRFIPNFIPFARSPRYAQIGAPLQ